jgi:hypothetical protein
MSGLAAPTAPVAVMAGFTFINDVMFCSVTNRTICRLRAVARASGMRVTSPRGGLLADVYGIADNRGPSGGGCRGL